MTSRVSTVYLPQVSLDTHLSTNPFERMNSWVSCAPTPLVRDQTGASGFVVRHSNHRGAKLRVRSKSHLSSTKYIDSGVHKGGHNSKTWDSRNATYKLG